MKETLRFREVAHAEANLAHLVVRLGGRIVDEVAELLGGAARLRFRLRPGAAQAQHFRAMHTADPRIRRLRVRLAPVHRRLIPLRGATVIGELLARAHHVAVRAPRGVRIELPAHRRGHRLVDQRHPLGDATLLHEDASLVLERERLEVAVIEAPRDLHRLLCQRKRLVEIVLALHGDHRVRPREPPVLRRLRHVAQMSLGPLQPTVAHRLGQLVHVIFGQRDGDATRATQVAPLEVARVRPLARADAHLALPEPPRRLREVLEVLGGEVHRRIGLTERLVRPVPIARLEGGEPLPQRLEPRSG